MFNKRILRKLSCILFFCLIISGCITQESANTKKQVCNTGIRAIDDMHSVIMIEAPRKFQSMMIYPITMERVKDLTHYASLDEALEKKYLRITEWGSGQVPQLKAEKSGQEKLFIMTGEIITGAKQDRMSAHDILLPVKREAVSLPVYCVEQGRWVRQSNTFKAGKTAVTKKLRKSAVKKSSQGKIWNDVAKKSKKSGVNSSTGTMQAVYNDPKIKQSIKKYVDAFKDLPDKTTNMVGYISVINKQIESVDVFVNPGLFKSLWEKLLRAAAVDAITVTGGENKSLPALKDIQNFIVQGMTGEFRKIDNPGAGEEFLIECENGISGGALFNDDKVIHLTLFSSERGDNPRELRLDANQSQKRTGANGSKEYKRFTGTSKKNKKIKIKTYKDKKK